MAQSRDGLKRIQQIVGDLRDFARIDESELKEVDLNAGIAIDGRDHAPLAIQQQVALEMDLERPAAGHLLRRPRSTRWCSTCRQRHRRQPARGPGHRPDPALGRGDASIDVIDEGLRHRPGHPRQDLRPVLHDEAGRQGNRPGAVDQLRHRPVAWRADRGRLDARARGRGSPSICRSSRCPSPRPPIDGRPSPAATGGDGVPVECRDRSPYVDESEERARHRTRRRGLGS